MCWTTWRCRSHSMKEGVTGGDEFTSELNDRLPGHPQLRFCLDPRLIPGSCSDTYVVPTTSSGFRGRACTIFAQWEGEVAWASAVRNSARISWSSMAMRLHR